MNKEQDAMIKRYIKVRSTKFEMFSLSERMALVEVSIAAKILFKALVSTKNTAVSFLEIYFKGISLIDKACTEVLIIADHTST
jgi:hypothetical protein